MEAAELELFDRTVRAATEAHTGVDLDAALTELGWHEALAHDPRAAVSVLFGHQGRVPSASSSLDDVVAAGFGADIDPDVAVVLPELGRAAPPARDDGAGVVLRGLGTSRLVRAPAALVVAATSGGPRGVMVRTAELTVRPVLGMDPDLGLVEVTGALGPGAWAPAIGATRWDRALARGRLALGHEMVGAAAAMLELARTHALDRVQFGRPIAAYQAVRHRLADTLVALESARALLDAAWQAGTAETAAMAKSVSGRSARSAARHCQQVLAGMGFTLDHPLHRYVQRVLVLDELLGSSRSLTAELGRAVLARRRLPPPVPL